MRERLYSYYSNLKKFCYIINVFITKFLFWIIRITLWSQSDRDRRLSGQIQHDTLTEYRALKGIKEALSVYFIGVKRFPSIKYNKVQSRVPSVHVCFTVTYFWSEKKEEVIPFSFCLFYLKAFQVCFHWFLKRIMTRDHFNTNCLDKTRTFPQFLSSGLSSDSIKWIKQNRKR